MSKIDPLDIPSSYREVKKVDKLTLIIFFLGGFLLVFVTYLVIYCLRGQLFDDLFTSDNNDTNVTDEDSETSNNNQAKVLIGADSIQIVNLTDTGFTVIWVSEKEEIGYISYGTSVDILNKNSGDKQDNLGSRKSHYVHFVSVDRLLPGTSYYFVIHSGDNIYDNGGSKYSVKTFDTLSSPPSSLFVTGKVMDLPEHGEAIITAYIHREDESGNINKSFKISTFVDSDGRWTLSLGGVFSEDGSSYFSYSSNDLVYIDVLTTVSSDTYVKSIENLEAEGIDISL